MFKVDDHVRISKYQNNSAKGCTSALSKEAFEIKKSLKILCRGHMLLEILRMKKLLEFFMK